jgi:hypothetical protein
MKGWHRVTLALIVGLLAGGGAAWHKIGQGMSNGRLHNGPWTTALNYGTTDTDALTRASVALRGLLALPSTETVYWSADNDKDGKPLAGNCTYSMTGGALDARWWSVTYYDRKGYLVANPANIWSFSGASLTEADKGGWRVAITRDKPNAGHWLPSRKDQPFNLTLRMYNPGEGFRKAPDKAALPIITREACA